MLTPIQHKSPCRIAVAGTVERRAVVIAAMLACLAGATADAAVYYQGGKAITILPDSSRVVIQYDPATPAGMKVDYELKIRGFGETKPLAERQSTGRFTVTVTDSSRDTLRTIRSIPGVISARRIYQIPDVADALYETNQIVFKPKAGVTMQQITELMTKVDCQLVRPIGIGITRYVARVVDEDTSNSVEAAARVAQSGLVDYCNPDFVFRVNYFQVAIEDPLYPFQWHLHNTGQTGGLAGADVKALEAWSITEGENAVVAVIDDAIDWQHPDLVDAVVARLDAADRDDDPSPVRPGLSFRCRSQCDGDVTDEDPSNDPIYCMYDPCKLFSCWGYESHGTSTSGLAVAHANDVGVRGVAPKAGLIPVRLSEYLSYLGAIDGFNFAADTGTGVSANVISNSWGGLFQPDDLTTTIEDVTYNGRGGLGCLVMFSSGNSGDVIEKNSGQAVLYNVLSVGATLKNDRLTCYSSFGKYQGVVAPGGGSHIGDPVQCDRADMSTTDVTSFELDLETDPVYQLGYVACDETGLEPYPPLTGYNPIHPGEETIYPPQYTDPYYNKMFNGTSAACPVAAGVAALVFSANPSLTAWQARGILEHTADRIDPDHLGGYDAVTGKNNLFGHGRVNALRAVQAAKDGKTWPAFIDPDTITRETVANRVQLRWENPPADVAAVMIVRAVGALNFTPVDGTAYTVGQTVAPNTKVVFLGTETSFTDENAPEGELNYGLFVVNAANYYSWGVRESGVATKPTTTTPLAAITAAPSGGPAPLTVLLSGGGVDPQGRALDRFLWNFGDGQTQETTLGTITHTYNEDGTYLATLRVRNVDGVWTPPEQAASVLVTVTEAAPTTAPNFTIVVTASPSTGASPLEVTFRVYVNPTTTFIRQYAWNFGDGQTQVTEEATVKHTYTNSGSYSIAVTATDFFGVSSLPAGASVTVLGAGASAARDTGTTDSQRSLPCAPGMVPVSLAIAATLMGYRSVSRRRGRRAGE